MNAQLIPIESMSVAERAANALSREETETEIKALVEKSKPIVAVTDSASREVCHDSLMTLKNMRVLIEKRAKAGREEAVSYSKAVIAIEKDLVKLISPEETRLAILRDEWDSAKQREKEAAILREISRVAAIQERIAELRGCQTLSPSSGSTLILEHIQDLDAIPVDSTFEEFEQSAHDAKIAALVRLKGILGAAMAHEAEQAKIVAERAELAKLREAEEQRQAAARDEQAEKDRLALIESDRLAREAKDKRDAEALEQAEANRKERERIAKEDADAKAIRAAEDKRLADVRAQQEAADKAARDAVAERLRMDREENERKAAERQAELDKQAEAQRVEAKRLADQQAALTEAQKPKPEQVKVRTVERPSAAQIVACVASHYSVSAAMATKWLVATKIELEAA